MLELFKTYKQQHPLSLRIVLMIVVCSGLFAMLVTVAQLYSRYHSEQEDLAQRLADAESAYLDDINEALWRLDEPLIRQNIEGIQRLPFIVRAQLITEQKKVYSVGQQVESRWVYERAYDIVRNSDRSVPLGQLKVWVDARSIFQNVKDQAIEALALQAVKITIVSVLILSILHLMLFRHLKALHRVATSLSTHNLSLKFRLERPGRTPDELDHVCKALDDMRFRLKKGVDEIQAMQTEMRRIYLAADSSSSAVAIFSVADGTCLYRNNGYRHYFGGVDQLSRLLGLLEPDTAFTQWLVRLKQNGSWQHELFWPDRQQPRWLSARCLFYKDDDEELVMLTASDISELREAHERERHLMEHDLLTGLPNVQAGLQEAKILLQQAEQESLRLAVMAFSLQSFKPVVESFGTRYADQLVLRSSETLSTFIPEDAVLARSADDQFICAMLLHQPGDNYLLALLEQLGQWHAIQQLGTEQPELFEHPDARLALAVALRHQNSSSQALALLAPMLASPDSSIETESEWALNLCLSKGADALMAQVQQRQWSWQQCLQLADYIAEEASPASAACLYQAVLRLQPDNAHAQHMRDAAAGNCTAEAPAGYVQALYNTHATEFEHRLKQRLGYRAPEQLAQLLAELITPPERGLDVLDLGCGTGLCGQSLKSTLPIRYLAGCDLAQQMLELAADKNLYDALHCQDLLSALTQSKPVDLITATDVLIYTGDLHPVCQAAAEVLRDGGWFAFTVEAAEDDHPVSLQASGRYRHSHRHIESAANASGLRLLQCIRFPLRLEHQRQLTGLMAVLEYRPTHSDGNTPNS